MSCCGEEASLGWGKADALCARSSASLNEHAHNQWQSCVLPQLRVQIVALKKRRCNAVRLELGMSGVRCHAAMHRQAEVQNMWCAMQDLMLVTAAREPSPMSLLWARNFDCTTSNKLFNSFVSLSLSFVSSLPWTTCVSTWCDKMCGPFTCSTWWVKSQVCLSTTLKGCRLRMQPNDSCFF